MKNVKLYIIACVVMLSSCTWKHDGKILKDKDGNLYRIEAVRNINESYDLKPLPTADIDSLLKSR